MAKKEEQTNFIELDTTCGRIRGICNSKCNKFLGLRYAKANRFEYSKLEEPFTETYDATKMGDSCPQSRTWVEFEHLDNPERLFYHKEYRKGIKFNYSEDCLNLNIFTPNFLTTKSLGESLGPLPVIVFIHGGGFNSGSNSEMPFDGTYFAQHGIITVFINYRVGILGYLTHEDIQKANSRDGNFGLDDQIQALKWVKAHIASFGGDPNNITVMGQSAGAMSIQYMVINKANEGLFNRAIMISGAGLFPKFSLPKKACDCHEYWLELMSCLGCSTLENLKGIGLRPLFEAVEKLKTKRKDTIYNTMPVVDGVLIPEPVDKLIKKPLQIDYMISYTNCDMYAPILAHIGNVFAKNNNGYRYFFDINAPGDNNLAFHSCDLVYIFGMLGSSWRPYGKRDYEASSQLVQYISNFAKYGDVNKTYSIEPWAGEKSKLSDNASYNFKDQSKVAELPKWERNRVICFGEKETKMGHPGMFKMTCNFLKKGSPKAL